MTLLQKIQNLTWYDLINKLKDILNSVFTITQNLDTRITNIENNPIDSRPYKVYTALISQSGTSAPTAVVLENTLGQTPIYEYNGVGGYILTSIGVFVENKTAIFGQFAYGETEKYISFNIVDFAPNSISINTFGSGGVQQNNVLNSTVLEIRVYN